jgi:hypothetical protein
MDILTPKGQETLAQEREAISLFLQSFPGFEFIETPKDTPADIDGFITRDGTIISGVEVKCRNMTVDVLDTKYKYQWLVTADKLDRGVSVCERLGTDFRGFLYLVPDKMLFIVPIFSYKDGWLIEPEYEMTKTQATVNGGHAERLNAYVDVSKAKVIASL